MYPGLGEWWLHKGVINLQNLVIFNIYAQIVSIGFLVGTLFCVKWLAKLSIFIHADILVLVSELVVIWWSVPTTADHCGHIPDYSILHCYEFRYYGHLNNN